MRQYEIVYDKFHQRWAFKPQGLPGSLQVAKTKAELIEKAVPICNNQPCTLRIHMEDGKVEEERSFGTESGGLLGKRAR
jgi:hypothetical protein